MPDLQINLNSGAVYLPIGFVIESTLSQDDFLKTPIAEHVIRQDDGARPWGHFWFSGGTEDGRELLVGLSYSGQELAYITIAAQFYAEDVRDWSDYSLDLEAETKRFHDSLLEKILGTPSTIGHVQGICNTDVPEILYQPLFWKFPWGSVLSGHDGKGGGTSIRVEYGKQRKEPFRNDGYRST